MKHRLTARLGVSEIVRAGVSLRASASYLWTICEVMENEDKVWLVLRTIDSEDRGLEEDELLLFYEKLEEVDSNQLFSILSLYKKVIRNPDSLRSLRKSVGEYQPKQRTRSRPHRSQRKRGYTDKGSLPDSSSKILRKAIEEDVLHIRVMEDFCPTFLRKLSENRLSALEGEHVFLSELNKSIEILKERDSYSRDIDMEISDLFAFLNDLERKFFN